MPLGATETILPRQSQRSLKGLYNLYNSNDANKTVPPSSSFLGQCQGDCGYRIGSSLHKQRQSCLRTKRVFTLPFGKSLLPSDQSSLGRCEHAYESGAAGQAQGQYACKPNLGDRAEDREFRPAMVVP